MILSHQKFDLDQHCLIEKVIIQAPFRFFANFRDEACFVYFTQGDTKINSALEQVAVHSGDAMLLKCGTYVSKLISHRSGDRFEILVFHLYPDVLRRIYGAELPASIGTPSGDSGTDRLVSGEIIKKFVDGLQFYFENPHLVNPELLILKIRELVLLLLQSKNADSITALFSDLFSPRDVRIKQMVHVHLFTPLTIKDLADLAEMSVSTFVRTFQRLYGQTPANYIREKRLEKAKELLRLSAQTISEIAFDTQFNDVAHFSRSFKSLYGVTPSEYRRSIQPVTKIG